jgi:hypothetical protein
LGLPTHSHFALSTLLPLPFVDISRRWVPGGLVGVGVTMFLPSSLSRSSSADRRWGPAALHDLAVMTAPLPIAGNAREWAGTPCHAVTRSAGHAGLRHP